MSHHNKLWQCTYRVIPLSKCVSFVINRQTVSLPKYTIYIHYFDVVWVWVWVQAHLRILHGFAVWRIAWTNFFLGFGNEMYEPNRVLISKFLPFTDPFTSGDYVLIYFYDNNYKINRWKCLWVFSLHQY